MSPRRRPMTRAEVTTRQQHAHAFAVAAELVSSLGHDAGMTQLGNTVASLAVLSGISAGDAICGAVLGERAAGESHAEAVDLLRRATPGTNYAAQLKRLIDAKGDAQYSAMLITEARAAELMVSARNLLVGMDAVIRGLP